MQRNNIIPSENTRNKKDQKHQQVSQDKHPTPKRSMYIYTTITETKGTTTTNMKHKEKNLDFL